MVSPALPTGHSRERGTDKRLDEKPNNALDIGVHFVATFVYVICGRLAFWVHRLTCPS